MKERKDESERLIDQLKILQYCGWSNEIYSKHLKEIDIYDPHKETYETEESKVKIYHAFKEVLISYYTGIAINVTYRRVFGNICFVDATAGIGIVPLLLEDKVIPIFGSAVIPLITPTLGEIYFKRGIKPFKKVFLMEINDDRRMVLKKVINELLSKLEEIKVPIPDIEMKYYDFNSHIGDVLNKYKDNCKYWLVVIDPTGADIEWNAIKALLNARENYGVIVDVMFNFMCGSLRRQKSEACSSKKHAFNKFFGDEGWKKCCSEEGFGECLHNYYADKIRKLNYEVYGSSIWRMENSWHYHFDLIVYKHRKKSHPWVQPYRSISEYIINLREDGLYRMLTNGLLINYMQKDRNIGKSLSKCLIKNISNI